MGPFAIIERIRESEMFFRLPVKHYTQTDNIFRVLTVSVVRGTSFDIRSETSLLKFNIAALIDIYVSKIMHL